MGVTEGDGGGGGGGEVARPPELSVTLGRVTAACHRLAEGGACSGSAQPGVSVPGAGESGVELYLLGPAHRVGGGGSSHGDLMAAGDSEQCQEGITNFPRAACLGAQSGAAAGP